MTKKKVLYWVMVLFCLIAIVAMYFFPQQITGQVGQGGLAAVAGGAIICGFIATLLYRNEEVSYLVIYGGWAKKLQALFEGICYVSTVALWLLWLFDMPMGFITAMFLVSSLLWGLTAVISYLNKKKNSYE